MDWLLADLAGLVTRHGNGTVEDLLDGITRGRVSDEGPVDDVAVLTLRASGLSATHLRLNLPATSRSVTAFRHTLRRWLKIGGDAGEEAFGILVAAGEAASNAVEHAYDVYDARFEIEGRRSGDTVTITIRDFGRWRTRAWARGALVSTSCDRLSTERRLDEAKPGRRSTYVTL